ncbi:MAG: hypothetical protein DCC74_06860 [Proteobacteria bacterium]|nr:MAG: hypothetical protein DCC74_06860 [Pseudomonadota bacterium]
MRLDRSRLCCGLWLALACVATPSAVLASPFDGQWTVTIVTNAGDCQPSASYPVVVSDGRISAAGTGELAGKVNSSGVVRVSLQGAHGNGQLSGNSGSGKWNGASAGVACSGRWQASRN